MPTRRREESIKEHNSGSKHLGSSIVEVCKLCRIQAQTNTQNVSLVTMAQQHFGGCPPPSPAYTLEHSLVFPVGGGGVGGDIAQSSPLNPLEQLQTASPLITSHLPRFRQRTSSQVSVRWLHTGPVYGEGHMQKNPLW